MSDLWELAALESITHEVKGVTEAIKQSKLPPPPPVVITERCVAEAKQTGTDERRRLARERAEKKKESGGEWLMLAFLFAPIVIAKWQVLLPVVVVGVFVGLVYGGTKHA